MSIVKKVAIRFSVAKTRRLDCPGVEYFSRVQRRLRIFPVLQEEHQVVGPDPALLRLVKNSN